MKRFYTPPLCETIHVTYSQPMLTASNNGYPVVTITDPFSTSIASPTNSLDEQFFFFFNE